MASCQSWCSSPAAAAYHDEEWGVPVHEDRQHFEDLCMESFQSGLNWNLVLGKREILRKCFRNFEPGLVAELNEADVEAILAEPGMIRSRRKVEAIIGNARAFLEIKRKWGSFDRFIWSYTEGKTLVYRPWENVASNDLSDRICKDLKKQGFRFLGTVTVYSYLQACGIVNDHAPDCPCFEKICHGADLKWIQK